MGYFCTQCKRKHHSGKIFEQHKHLKQIEPNGIPTKKIINVDWKLLPNIAKRQIRHYINKLAWDMNCNGSNRKEMYIHEINRVILHYDNEIPIKL